MHGVSFEEWLAHPWGQSIRAYEQTFDWRASDEEHQARATKRQLRKEEARRELFHRPENTPYPISGPCEYCRRKSPQPTLSKLLTCIDCTIDDQVTRAGRKAWEAYVSVKLLLDGAKRGTCPMCQEQTLLVALSRGPCYLPDGVPFCVDCHCISQGGSNMGYVVVERRRSASSKLAGWRDDRYLDDQVLLLNEELAHAYSPARLAHPDFFYELSALFWTHDEALKHLKPPAPGLG